MPKAVIVTKERIFKAAFDLVRTEGFQALTARNVAQKIGFSTQPIYWVYKNMEELRQEIILEMLDLLKQQLRTYYKTGKPFLDLGLGYVNIAHTEPVFFKAIYMDNILNFRLIDLIPGDMLLNAIKNDMPHIKDRDLQKTSLNAWMFVHGLATLVVSRMMAYDEEKIKQMLIAIIE